MALRTSPGHLLLLCLSPPGNVRRELALYRRRLFASGWAASCFALPELAVLGGIGRPPPALGKILASALAGLEGDFRSSSPAILGPSGARSLCLPLGPCLMALEERLGRAFESAGAPAPGEISPFPRAGIFLASPPEVPGAPLPDIPPSPSLSFHSAAIILLEISPPPPGLEALVWSELLRVHRRRAKLPQRHKTAPSGP